MSQKFIDQVRALIMSNISDEKFGVQDLASQLGLSSSQTLRKVKAETGKSVNQYIRELRLEKAAKLIKKTDLTIAEISYQVGFGSHSYFNNAFVKYYGIAPGEYKTKSASLSKLAVKAIKKKHRETSLKMKIFYPVILVLVFVIGYLLINNSTTKKKSFENSIAVLPFKNYSPEDSQWFSDGISDNILHSLAQMKDVSVSSFTSSSTYRGTDKQIPEIAKELGVSYVLEGSVTLVEDKIKIITQLIDANDQHVWSKEYNDIFNNVITIQNNVAQEVMQHIKTILSTEEQKILKKYPTDNMEAYNLYLEGRRINESIKLNDLRKNMANNEKAIGLDSNFVEAYADLATTKLIIAIKGYTYAYSAKEAMTYIDKALAIAPNSAKANAIKARLLLSNDRSNSESYFKKALALNPNDADLRHWYAKYLMTADKPNLEKALKQETIANKLSPFSSEIAMRYVWLLVLNKKFDMAETYMADYGFLLNEWNRHVITLWTLWLKSITLGGKSMDYLDPMRALLDWSYDQLEEQPEKAAFYNFNLAFLNDQFKDKPKAVEFAKKAYELDGKYLSDYMYRLTKNGFLEEAEQLMKTDAFQEKNENAKKFLTWQYYYYKKDYTQAYNLIKDNPGKWTFSYRDISRTYAQLGYRNKLDSIRKLYFVQGEQKYFNRAFEHAILKERDSMYYYLAKLKYTFFYSLPYLNEHNEFDPYRQEERYKDILRELYLPTEPVQYIPVKER